MSGRPHPEASRFVEAGGVRWHVQEAGDRPGPDAPGRDGPVMLLIHGTGASAHSWRAVMPLLAPHYRLLAVDLPGHGLTRAASKWAAGSQGRSVSGAPARIASIEGMSSGIAALLKQLGVTVNYCVGHSAGAVILCRMALDGSAVPRVIVSLNGAFVPLPGPAATLFQPVARLLAGASLLPRLLSWGAGSRSKVAQMIEATGSHLDAEGVELYTRLVRRPEHVAGALAMMGNWDLYAFERDLRRLRTPLALIVAQNDRTVPPQQAEWVKQRVPQAEIHRLPGFGHLAHEEAPALLAGKIQRICSAYP
jgi:magnesium chelatase accessory protein